MSSLLPPFHLRILSKGYPLEGLFVRCITSCTYTQQAIRGVEELDTLVRVGTTVRATIAGGIVQE